jgi:hypothetical protein
MYRLRPFGLTGESNAEEKSLPIAAPTETGSVEG